MDAFSPLSRRIIAVGLLVLAVLLAINLIIVPLGQANADQLDALAAARMQLKHVEAIASTEPPAKGDPVPSSALIIAPNRDAGMATMVSALSASGAKFKLAPPALTMGPISGPFDDPHLIVDVAVAGSETDIVAFIADVELTVPAIRFQSWSIFASDGPGGQSKLQARAVAIWMPRP